MAETISKEAGFVLLLLHVDAVLGMMTPADRSETERAIALELFSRRGKAAADRPSTLPVARVESVKRHRDDDR